MGCCRSIFSEQNEVVELAEGVDSWQIAKLNKHRSLQCQEER